MPIADDDLTYFIGVRTYDGPGNELPPLSCNGNALDFKSGYRGIVTGFGGTFIAHNGCKVYCFRDYNFQEYIGSVDCRGTSCRI